MRICSGAGCLAVVQEGTRYCDVCATEHAQEARLSGHDRARVNEYQAQYMLPRWHKGIRPRVLHTYPICDVCHAAPSRVVDHHIPARLIVRVCRELKLFPYDRMGGFYILANLRGLCHSCHNRKTATEDRLDWTAEIERILQPYIYDPS